MYFIYVIEKNDVIQEQLYNINWYLNRNNCAIKKPFYRVFIIVKGMNTSRNPFCGYFSFECLFVLMRFHSVVIFNRCIPLVSVMLSREFINFHVWLFLFCVRCLTCWVLPNFFTLVSIFTCQYGVCIRSEKDGKCLPLFVPTSQTVSYVFCSQCSIISNACVSKAEILNDSGISFLCQSWKSCICFIKFLLVSILPGFRNYLIPTNGGKRK